MADLFDVDDLAAYLKTTVDADAADIAARIATSAVFAELGVDPSATGEFTVYARVNAEGYVRLPPLFGEITAVTTVDDSDLTYTHRPGAGVLSIDYYPWGDTWETDRRRTYEIKVTYTYSDVPGPIRDAALLIAASVYGRAMSSSVGVASETVGPFSVNYENSSTLTTVIPPTARALLRRYLPSVDSVRLR